jgi:hypothetical protein
MATQMDRAELDLQEQLTRIRQMGVNTDKAIAEMQKTRAETDVLPRVLIFQAMLAMAALLGAGAAIAKLFFP